MPAVHTRPSNDGRSFGAGSAAAPALIAACSFACVSVFGKVSFLHGADIATFLCARGLIGTAAMAIWLKGVPRPRIPTARERTVGLVLGLLFAANVYTLFRAIALIPVGIVELTYFLYPLLTGVVGAATGLDRIGVRGVIASMVALGGLALMVWGDAHGLAWAGLAFAAAAAVFRSAMLLVTRAALPAADPRDTSWYTMVGSTAIFAALLALQGEVQLPVSPVGWAALTWASLAAAIALIAMFASARRIGPFRTALLMNAEPLAAIVLSWLVLDETLTGLQWAGAAVMIGSLVWFQLGRKAH
jgi:drug/metabolite transporter (DMT)-like permease